MSNSFDEVFVIGGSLLMGVPLPLTALQIIWVNLFTGSLPALAFAFDEDMDKEKKVGREAHLVFTRNVKTLILGPGLLSSLLLFILYYFLIQTGTDLSVVRSVFFVCFSSYILVIAFSLRSLNHSVFSYSIFSNKKLNLGIIIGVVILVVTMTIPRMRDIFELGQFPLVWAPFVLFWIIFNILLVEGTKYLLRRTKQSSVKKLANTPSLLV